MKKAGEILAVILFTTLFVKGFSHDPAVNLFVARLYINQRQDYASAEKLLRSEAEKYPDDADVQLTLAQCYLQLGQFEKAVPHFKKVLSLQPDNKQILRILKAIGHDRK